MIIVLEEYLLKAKEEEKSKGEGPPHPAISGFWYGKFLQKVFAEGGVAKMEGIGTLNLLGVPINVHVQDGKAQLAKCHTSLSPNVYRLIMQSLPIKCCHDDDYLDDHLTLDWSFVKRFDLSADYSCLVSQLGVLAAGVHQKCFKTNKELLLETWKPFLNWTHHPEIFIDCFNLLFSGCNDGPHLSLIVIAAAIERSLGDVYLQVSNASNCPRHMKDLLATKELSQLLGAEPVVCLKCLIGPPGGLNLRNVVWHGFAAQDEIPIEYVTLLLVLVVSLGKIIQNKLDASSLIHRPFVSFQNHETIINNVLPTEYSSSDIEEVVSIFEDSYFILPSILPILKSAVNLYKNRRYGHCLCLLLPALEHSLRRLYACCNGCHERILTAESATLYTTFDEILSPVLNDGITPNALADEIGISNMEMLMDILMYPEGPKLRDRISHGEVDLFTMSHALAGHVLSMCLSCSLLYCVNYHIKKDSIIDKVSSNGMKYVSLYHPSSLLHREMVSLVEELEKWKEIETFNLTEEDNDDGLPILCTTLHSNYPTALLQLMDSFPYFHTSDSCSNLLAISTSLSCFHGNSALLSLIEEVWGIPHNTLYSSRQKMETIGLLRRIINNLLNTVKQVADAARLRYNLYRRKELRSRQRNNFDRLLSSVGNYWSFIGVVFVLVCFSVAWSHDQSHDLSKMIKFLKKVLSFCENFSSQTSSAKNRWEESDKICSDCIEFIITSLSKIN
ncbi:PREDICTED: endoplasmic reticulum membrane-associated RNA degradation protein-like isoform X2 [Amphimedon queenslandica]|uniref:DUF4209 domain-containing protein n=1 Tax=Amphimedon queenslandica TaxID=400682 RepID=A0AAN0J989_AMPQE|nr:PREDICTED: endoplasmic reticulum membrane-associated RNA degradation protein-like isoform X2 [Amphimedon queenslandica]|eukprot:XP_019853268.1 PREDICTED: endoplasmic reticulum membrane-associated RNA degradation protein-like isoform X2 [Amphimedon queenslandica]